MTTNLSVKGVVLEGLRIDQRLIQEKITKFWGINNESRIFGGRGGREINVPVIIYDTTDFDTPRKLSDYIHGTLNGTAQGTGGQLTIMCPSNPSPLDDVRYGGAVLLDGPKKDDAGTLGGQYWAICVLSFRQLS
ncbi:MAG: hypothetical protein AB7G28_20640 [Pirellulales bacterium]